jgi:hypothetical protein
MAKFGPKTKVRFECDSCEKKELVTLGDLPTTPKGKFIKVPTLWCMDCLCVATCVVREEDQE